MSEASLAGKVVLVMGAGSTIGLGRAMTLALVGAGGSPPEGRPVLGGHLHWLDSKMPGRDTGAS